MIKKIFRKIRCKIFFCIGSRCTYNENGNGKINLDLNEENILSNINGEIDKVNKIEEWDKEVPSSV